MPTKQPASSNNSIPSGTNNPPAANATAATRKGGDSTAFAGGGKDASYGGRHHASSAARFEGSQSNGHSSTTGSDPTGGSHHRTLVNVTSSSNNSTTQNNCSGMGIASGSASAGGGSAAIAGPHHQHHAHHSHNSGAAEALHTIPAHAALHHPPASAAALHVAFSSSSSGTSSHHHHHSHPTAPLSDATGTLLATGIGINNTNNPHLPSPVSAQPSGSATAGAVGRRKSPTDAYAGGNGGGAFPSATRAALETVTAAAHHSHHGTAHASSPSPHVHPPPPTTASTGNNKNSITNNPPPPTTKEGPSPPRSNLAEGTSTATAAAQQSKGSAHSAAATSAGCRSASGPSSAAAAPLSFPPQRRANAALVVISAATAPPNNNSNNNNSGYGHFDDDDAAETASHGSSASAASSVAVLGTPTVHSPAARIIVTSGSSVGMGMGICGGGGGRGASSGPEQAQASAALVPSPWDDVTGGEKAATPPTTAAVGKGRRAVGVVGNADATPPPAAVAADGGAIVGIRLSPAGSGGSGPSSSRMSSPQPMPLQQEQNPQLLRIPMGGAAGTSGGGSRSADLSNADKSLTPNAPLTPLSLRPRSAATEEARDGGNSGEGIHGFDDVSDAAGDGGGTSLMAAPSAPHESNGGGQSNEGAAGDLQVAAAEEEAGDAPLPTLLNYQSHNHNHRLSSTVASSTALSASPRRPPSDSADAPHRLGHTANSRVLMAMLMMGSGDEGGGEGDEDGHRGSIKEVTAASAAVMMTTVDGGGGASTSADRQETAHSVVVAAAAAPSSPHSSVPRASGSGSGGGGGGVASKAVAKLLSNTLLLSSGESPSTSGVAATIASPAPQLQLQPLLLMSDGSTSPSSASGGGVPMLTVIAPTPASALPPRAPLSSITAGSPASAATTGATQNRQQQQPPLSVAALQLAEAVVGGGSSGVPHPSPSTIKATHANGSVGGNSSNARSAISNNSVGSSSRLRQHPSSSAAFGPGASTHSHPSGINALRSTAANSSGGGGAPKTAGSASLPPHSASAVAAVAALSVSQLSRRGNGVVGGRSPQRRGLSRAAAALSKSSNPSSSSPSPSGAALIFPLTAAAAAGGDPEAVPLLSPAATTAASVGVGVGALFAAPSPSAPLPSAFSPTSAENIRNAASTGAGGVSGDSIHHQHRHHHHHKHHHQSKHSGSGGGGGGLAAVAAAAAAQQSDAPATYDAMADGDVAILARFSHVGGGGSSSLLADALRTSRQLRRGSLGHSHDAAAAEEKKETKGKQQQQREGEVSSSQQKEAVATSGGWGGGGGQAAAAGLSSAERKKQRREERFAKKIGKLMTSLKQNSVDGFLTLVARYEREIDESCLERLIKAETEAYALAPVIAAQIHSSFWAYVVQQMHSQHHESLVSSTAAAAAAVVGMGGMGASSYAVVTAADGRGGALLSSTVNSGGSLQGQKRGGDATDLLGVGAVGSATITHTSATPSEPALSGDSPSPIGHCRGTPPSAIVNTAIVVSSSLSSPTQKPPPAHLRALAASATATDSSALLLSLPEPHSPLSSAAVSAGAAVNEEGGVNAYQNEDTEGGRVDTIASLTTAAAATRRVSFEKPKKSMARRGEKIAGGGGGDSSDDFVAAKKGSSPSKQPPAISSSSTAITVSSGADADGSGPIAAYSTAVPHSLNLSAVVANAAATAEAAVTRSASQGSSSANVGANGNNSRGGFAAVSMGASITGFGNSLRGAAASAGPIATSSSAAAPFSGGPFGASIGPIAANGLASSGNGLGPFLSFPLAEPPTARRAVGGGGGRGGCPRRSFMAAAPADENAAATGVVGRTGSGNSHHQQQHFLLSPSGGGNAAAINSNTVNGGIVDPSDRRASNIFLASSGNNMYHHHNPFASSHTNGTGASSDAVLLSGAGYPFAGRAEAAELVIAAPPLRTHARPRREGNLSIAEMRRRQREADEAADGGGGNKFLLVRDNVHGNNNNGGQQQQQEEGDATSSADDVADGSLAGGGTTVNQSAIACLTPFSSDNNANGNGKNNKRRKKKKKKRLAPLPPLAVLALALYPVGGTVADLCVEVLSALGLIDELDDFDSDDGEDSSSSDDGEAMVGTANNTKNGGENGNGLASSEGAVLKKIVSFSIAATGGGGGVGAADADAVKGFGSTNIGDDAVVSIAAPPPQPRHRLSFSAGAIEASNGIPTSPNPTSSPSAFAAAVVGTPEATTAQRDAANAFLAANSSGGGAAGAQQQQHRRVSVRRGSRGGALRRGSASAASTANNSAAVSRTNSASNLFFASSVTTVDVSAPHNLQQQHPHHTSTTLGASTRGAPAGLRRRSRAPSGIPPFGGQQGDAVDDLLLFSPPRTPRGGAAAGSPAPLSSPRNGSNRAMGGIAGAGAAGHASGHLGSSHALFGGSGHRRRSSAVNSPAPPPPPPPPQLIVGPHWWKRLLPNASNGEEGVHVQKEGGGEVATGGSVEMKDVVGVNGASPVGLIHSPPADAMATIAPATAKEKKQCRRLPLPPFITLTDEQRGLAFRSINPAAAAGALRMLEAGLATTKRRRRLEEVLSCPTSQVFSVRQLPSWKLALQRAAERRAEEERERLLAIEEKSYFSTLPFINDDHAETELPFLKSGPPPQHQHDHHSHHHRRNSAAAPHGYHRLRGGDSESSGSGTSENKKSRWWSVGSLILGRRRPKEGYAEGATVEEGYRTYKQLRHDRFIVFLDRFMPLVTLIASIIQLAYMYLLAVEIGWGRMLSVDDLVGEWLVMDLPMILFVFWMGIAPRKVKGVYMFDDSFWVSFRRYSKSTFFWLDLFGAMPLDLAIGMHVGPSCMPITHNCDGIVAPYWRLNRLLLSRYSFWNLGDLIEEISTSKGWFHPIVGRIFLMLIYTITMAHVVACAMNIILHAYPEQAGWWKADKIYFERSTSDQYFQCLDWATKTFAAGWQGENFNLPLGIIIFVLCSSVVGIIMFASMIGAINTFLDAPTTFSLTVRKVEAVYESWQTHQIIDESLYRELRQFWWHQFKSTGGKGDMAMADALDGSSLAKPLQVKMLTQMGREILMKVPLLRNEARNEQFVRALAVALNPVVLAPFTIFCKKGDVGDSMAFVTYGTMGVVPPNFLETRDESSVFFVLRPGSFFGEIALVLGIARTATVSSLSRFTNLLVLSKEVFEVIGNDFPHVVSRLTLEAEARLAGLDASPEALVALRTQKLLDAIHVSGMRFYYKQWVKFTRMRLRAAERKRMALEGRRAAAAAALAQRQHRGERRAMLQGRRGQGVGEEAEDSFFGSGVGIGEFDDDGSYFYEEEGEEGEEHEGDWYEEEEEEGGEAEGEEEALVGREEADGRGAAAVLIADSPAFAGAPTPAHPLTATAANASVAADDSASAPLKAIASAFRLRPSSAAVGGGGGGGLARSTSFVGGDSFSGGPPLPRPSAAAGVAGGAPPPPRPFPRAQSAFARPASAYASAPLILDDDEANS